MNNSQKTGLEQVQTQRLIPMQIGVGNLLEMNAIQIEEEVKRKLEELPALEVADSSEKSQQDKNSDSESDLFDDNSEQKNEDDYDSGEVSYLNSDDSDTSYGESAEKMQMADYRTDDDIPTYLKKDKNGTYDPDDYTEPVVVDNGDTLIDSLTEQLSEHDITPRQENIAKYIIGNIDDSGYMARDIRSITDDIALQTGEDVSTDEVREMWQMIRTFDPAGVGAVDLRDCLLLQLQRRLSNDKTASKAVKDALEVIADYFDLFTKKHYDRLAAAMSISSNSLKAAIDVIRSLNPKPGSQFSSGGFEDGSRHIVPDFNVDVDGDELALTLLNNIPELQIEATFADDSNPEVLKVGRDKKEAMAFIRQRRDEAQMFIRMLATRQETLFRVMSAIVKIQRQFFLTGDVSKLRPMVLKDIASITGDDISVISRSTAGKYVSTPYGVYSLKDFFSERVNDDEDASSHEIIEEIKKIISAENKRKPISDEAITSLLVQKGYSVARRTVSKYREKSGIPVARLRKEL